MMATTATKMMIKNGAKDGGDGATSRAERSMPNLLDRSAAERVRMLDTALVGVTPPPFHITRR
jgi:hypothetical protein